MNIKFLIASIIIVAIPVLSGCPRPGPDSPYIPEPRAKMDFDNTSTVNVVTGLGKDCVTGKKVEVWALITGGPDGDSVSVEAYCGHTQVANTVVIVPRDNWADVNFDRKLQPNDQEAGCLVTPIFINPGNPSTFRASCKFE